jgi:hypothetical protein
MCHLLGKPAKHYHHDMVGRPATPPAIDAFHNHILNELSLVVNCFELNMYVRVNYYHDLAARAFYTSFALDIKRFVSLDLQLHGHHCTDHVYEDRKTFSSFQTRAITYFRQRRAHLNMLFRLHTTYSSFGYTTMAR